MGFLQNLFRKADKKEADEETVTKSLSYDEKRMGDEKTEEEKPDNEKTVEELHMELEKFQSKIQRTASYLERALKEGNRKDAERFQAKMEYQESRLAEIEKELERRYQ